jgi:hypothetical protein
VHYYADTGRALAKLDGRNREAVRMLLIAERIAPQHGHPSADIREATQSLLERSPGPELRRLAERMHV